MVVSTTGNKTMPPRPIWKDSETKFDLYFNVCKEIDGDSTMEKIEGHSSAQGNAGYYAKKDVCTKQVDLSEISDAAVRYKAGKMEGR